MLVVIVIMVCTPNLLWYLAAMAGLFLPRVLQEVLNSILRYCYWSGVASMKYRLVVD